MSTQLLIIILSRIDSVALLLEFCLPALKIAVEFSWTSSLDCFETCPTTLSKSRMKFHQTIFWKLSTCAVKLRSFFVFDNIRLWFLILFNKIFVEHNQNIIPKWIPFLCWISSNCWYKLNWTKIKGNIRQKFCWTRLSNTKGCCRKRSMKKVELHAFQIFKKLLDEISFYF